MATGMAIMGFGGGAMIGAPLKELFIRTFYRAPDYLGTVDQVNLVTEAGGSSMPPASSARWWSSAPTTSRA